MKNLETQRSRTSKNEIIEDEPLVKRRGWLKNGNPPGDFSTAPRCGANSKRSRQACQAPAMKNGRCRMHGGKSTGPRTDEGKLRIGRARFKSGLYTKESNALKSEFQTVLSICKKLHGY